ncbi:unnamed protein product [Blumeria hordei]|uniref:Uncharacterized protein n=1 Tax=Blumeria hordei TaxID=2867405 RepID=A0A383UL86_BLUHO|nr:unnamed protein product [Blumeria hordei]
MNTPISEIPIPRIVGEGVVGGVEWLGFWFVLINYIPFEEFCLIKLGGGIWKINMSKQQQTAIRPANLVSDGLTILSFWMHLCHTLGHHSFYLPPRIPVCLQLLHSRESLTLHFCGFDTLALILIEINKMDKHDNFTVKVGQFNIST